MRGAEAGRGRSDPDADAGALADRQAAAGRGARPRRLVDRHLRRLRHAARRADGVEHLRRGRGDRAGVGLSRRPRRARPRRHRLARDRPPRRGRGRAGLRGARRAAPDFAHRHELCRAHRPGEDRTRAVRHLRRLHRHGAARQAPLRRLEPGAHGRADAGRRAFRRGAGGGEALPVSGRGQHPPRGLHAARRHVLRHRAPARLRRRLRRAAVPLRRLQRRPLVEPQRRAAERDQRRLGHPARARRRPGARRRSQRSPAAPRSRRACWPSGCV